MNKLLKVFIFSFIILGSLSITSNVFAARGTAMNAVTSDGNEVNHKITINSFTASPTSISTGGSSTLSWSASSWSSNVSPVCFISGLEIYTSALSSGSMTVYPPETENYTLFCRASDISALASVTVTVVTAPSGTISASNCTIAAGGNQCVSTVTWSVSNPNSVTQVIGNISWLGVYEILSTRVNSGSATLGSTYYPGEAVSLYHNSVVLAQTTSVASCVSGTTWNGQYCKTSSSNNNYNQSQSQQYYQPQYQWDSYTPSYNNSWSYYW